MIKLHLGCGIRHLQGFINIDIQQSQAVDLIADITNLPYEKNYADVIYSCSNLEHFGKNSKMEFFRNKSWKDALIHWYNILKPGGIIYISTVDFEAVCCEYLENRNLEQLIGIAIGGQKDEEDLHGMLYDENLLKKGMSEIGFKNIEKYNWWDVEMFQGENKNFDDFSRAYLPHMDFKNGRLMMLNIKGIK